jgi:hypothetical protein
MAETKITCKEILDEDDFDYVTFLFHYNDCDEEYAFSEFSYGGKYSSYEIRCGDEAPKMLWLNHLVKHSKWIPGEKLYIIVKSNCDNHIMATYSRNESSIGSLDFVINEDGYVYKQIYNYYHYHHNLDKNDRSNKFVMFQCTFNDNIYFRDR